MIQIIRDSHNANDSTHSKLEYILREVRHATNFDYNGLSAQSDAFESYKDTLLNPYKINLNKLSIKAALNLDNLLRGDYEIKFQQILNIMDNFKLKECPTLKDFMSSWFSLEFLINLNAVEDNTLKVTPLSLNCVRAFKFNKP